MKKQGKFALPRAKSQRGGNPCNEFTAQFSRSTCAGNVGGVVAGVDDDWDALVARSSLVDTNAKRVETGRGQQTEPAGDIFLDLSSEESLQLEERAGQGSHHPYSEFDSFFAEADQLFNRLPWHFRRALQDFAANGNAEGALMVRNLPRDLNLPSTPINSAVRSVMTTWVSEMLMCMVAAPLGQPIAYREERQGHIFHDVYPTRKNANKLSSESSSITLDFHTEMVFHPHAPDYLLLHGLRQDPDKNAVTSFSSTRRFVRLLPREVRDTLFREEFSLELSHLHSPYRFFCRSVREAVGSGPLVSILYGDPVDPFLRYEPELMAPQTKKAEQALRVVHKLVNETSRGIKIEPGCLLVLDNRRSAHARSTFKAYHDGRDRWLRRMMVVRSLKATGDDRVPGSRIISTDLGIGWAGRGKFPNLNDTPRMDESGGTL